MKATLPLSLLAVLSLNAPANINFVADYSGDGANEGFNDPVLGAARRAAFAHALTIWESYLTESYAGETIKVFAQFDPLGGTETSATLGSAFAPRGYITSGNTFAGGALANHFHGSNVNAGFNEINITFNSDVDNNFVLGTAGFYYGTDRNHGSDFDFVSSVLHEIAHGLDFSSDIKSDGTLNNPTLQKVYDTFLYDAAVGGNSLSSLSDAQRLTAITSGNVYWGGANAMAQNGGQRVRMYAPDPYEPGSSISHLDEATFSTFTLSPSRNDNITDHEISNLELAILEDMGWDVVFNTVPEPSGLLLMGLGMTTLGLRRKR